MRRNEREYAYMYVFIGGCVPSYLWAFCEGNQVAAGSVAPCAHLRNVAP